MHPAIQASLARQIAESRIADAERARAVREQTRSRRSGGGGGGARRLLGRLAHPSPPLARSRHPE